MVTFDSGREDDAQGMQSMSLKVWLQQQMSSRNGSVQILFESCFSFSLAICPWELINFLNLSFLIWPSGEPLHLIELG